MNWEPYDNHVLSTFDAESPAHPPTEEPHRLVSPGHCACGCSDEKPCGVKDCPHEVQITAHRLEARTRQIALEGETIVSALETIATVVDLGDYVYDVREREGRGWKGPKVKTYGAAVEALTAAMKRIKEAA